MVSELNPNPEKSLLPQEQMIARVRELCQQDELLVAALMYGSFTTGHGDRFSDIEFALFFEDDMFKQIDQQAWVSQIAPVDLYFVDDVGHNTAIFSNLIRGEFHFETASNINKVEAWQGNAWFPSLAATVLVDRTGELSRYLQPLLTVPDRGSPAAVQALSSNFINWFLFGVNVLARGERARALEILGLCHRYLLWMIRLTEDKTVHWPTPSRCLEQDISESAYARFVACTANLDSGSLRNAYVSVWSWGKELMRSLAQRYDPGLPESLLQKLDRLIVESGLFGEGS